MTDRVSDDDLSKLTDNELKGMALEAMIQVDYCKNGVINNELAAKYGSVEAIHEIETSIKEFIEEVGLETALEVQEGMRDLLMLEVGKRNGLKIH